MFQPDDEFLSNFLIVPRHADRAPDDAGQWGVALRYFAEEFEQYGLRVLLHELP